MGPKRIRSTAALRQRDIVMGYILLRKTIAEVVNRCIFLYVCLRVTY